MKRGYFRSRWFLALWFTLAASTQAAAQHAGEITALVPSASIERGSMPPTQADLRAPIYWRDWLETNAGGRARLGLVDGSIVNVGSAARLQVLEHQQTTGRSELELQFGKVRALVRKGSQSGSEFKVRTNTAVVGVLGTHFYLDATTVLTTVINFEGQVRVANAHPSIQGEEILDPFYLAEIEPDQPPRKRLATLAELLQAMEDTLPGPVTHLSPQKVRSGSCISATTTDALTRPIDADPGNTSSFPLQISFPGCKGRDITPVQVCVPKSTAPGLYEYGAEASDGSRRRGAFVVEPSAPLQDARLLYSPQLPPGATHTGRLVGRDNEPLAGISIQVRRNGIEQMLRTDENGGFALTAPEQGSIELEVNRGVLAGGAAVPPFSPLEPLRGTIKIVDETDLPRKVPEFSQRGSLVSVPGEVRNAWLGTRALPVLRTVTPAGSARSGIPVPPDMPEGATPLTLQDPAGERRTHTLTVYEILAGRLDQHALNSGQRTQGEFLACVGTAENRPRKVRARIVAQGPVRFRGQGGKGKNFERKLPVEPSGLLRVPFQLQAEKGAPGTGIPFVLTLRLENE